jgi:hypothetical protein
LRCQRLSECRSQLVGLKTKGARLALVSDFASRIDQINSVGPACIGSFRRVAKFVEDGGKLNAEFSYTRTSDKCPLFFIFRATENNFIFDVALHLPNVTGMRFGDVNNQEGDAIAILLVQFVEGRSLPPEWRSGVTSEHQYNRLALVQHGKLNPFAFIQLKQREIWGRISDVQAAGASVHPRGFKRKNQKRNGARHFGHHSPKGLWRLAHGPKDESSKSQISDHQNDKQPA